jgi:2-(3-amino-3-carboxypropyl)histidine synthase
MLALKSNKPVYVFNPYDQRLSKIEEKEVDEIARRKKVGYIKFLHASTLGILVSTKPGQQKLKEAFSLKNCLKRKSYVLIADDIEIESLRNFPFIDCFVNTACPRLLEDSSVAMVNMEDLGQWLG